MTRRVVSLAPSATEVVHTVGAGDQLIAGTDHGSIDASVGGWLTPDIETVEALEPDHVLTTDALQDDIAGELRARGIPTTHSSPQTLSAVYTYIREIGAAVNKVEAADRLAATIDERIQAISARVEGRERPVVYCEEWDEPPMVAGNWVPEIINAAGGIHPFCSPGERSRRIEQAEIEAHAPSHAIVHLCGKGENADPEAIHKRGWSIPHVSVIDDSLLNQPGPRLATATERIAHFLHPEVFDA